MKEAWRSKTIWVNVLALIGTVYVNQTGNNLPEGWDVWALSLINLILRVITKDKIVWAK